MKKEDKTGGKPKFVKEGFISISLFPRTVFFFFSYLSHSFIGKHCDAL